MMDASTSRLFLKAITNTRALGRVVIYMDADFRGGAEEAIRPACVRPTCRSRG